MSVDLSNEEIFLAYHNIVRGEENDWLLLKYSTRDKLYLSDTGSGDIDKVRERIAPDELYYGFCRVLDSQFVLFSYVPEGTSGVRRARTLVHSRNVAALFQAHQVMITISDISQLNVSTFQRKLELAAANPTSSVSYNPAKPPRHTLVGHGPAPVAALASTSNDNPELRDKREAPYSHTHSNIQHTSDEFDIPPPTPPKSAVFEPILGTIGKRAASESYGSLRSGGRGHFPYASTSQTEIRQHTVSTPVRRISATAVPLDEDPGVQERIRNEIRRLRVQSENEMAEAEAEAEANRIPSIADKHTSEEDNERAREKKAQDMELQRRLARRMLNEKMRKEQDEREERERLLKLEEDRNRRIQAAREAQAHRERTEIERIQAAKEKERQVIEMEASSKANMVQTRNQLIAGKSGQDILLEGHISVQSPEAPTWKRRYFEVSKLCLTIYKDDTKAHKLGLLPISGRKSIVKAWDEGFEELRSIPYSFAVAFSDFESPWLFYADSGHDKMILASLFYNPAGV